MKIPKENIIKKEANSLITKKEFTFKLKYFTLNLNVKNRLMSILDKFFKLFGYSSIKSRKTQAQIELETQFKQLHNTTIDRVKRLMYHGKQQEIEDNFDRLNDELLSHRKDIQNVKDILNRNGHKESPAFVDFNIIEMHNSNDLKEGNPSIKELKANDSDNTLKELFKQHEKENGLYKIKISEIKNKNLKL